jgi:hypothetical protein
MQRLIIGLASFSITLVAATGCGGGGSEKTPTSAAPTVAATPAADPASAEATVVATPYELELYHHDAVPRRQGSDVIDFPYDISLPKGWPVETGGVAVTAAVVKPDKFPYVSISVDCRPGVEKAGMLDRDGAAAASLDLGNLGSQPRSALSVAGRDAIRVDWQGGATFVADHISVYVDGKDCAWRLQLNTFGAIRAEQLSALFLRVVDAFNPDQGLP